MILRIIIYISAITVANLLVLFYGKYGLWFSSALLIPFDFVMRCYFHERWKGYRLILNLSLLIGTAAVVTYIINAAALNVALGSVVGFISANIFAGLVYQSLINKPAIYKVNISDLVAILIDSMVFQGLAFGALDFSVTAGQTLIKIVGGIIWYYIIFHLIKLKL